MEAWEKAFREYIAPQFSPTTLDSLRVAILNDDERLSQCFVSSSREYDMSDDRPAYYVCPVAYMAICEHGLVNNGEVQDAFANVARRASEMLDLSSPFGYFLAFVDKQDHIKVKAELLRVLNDILGNTNTEVSRNG